MNLDYTTVTRSGYTILDVLSDVGGIMSILFSAMSMFLSAWNYNHFDNFLVSRLFKVHRSEGQHA